MPRKFLTACAVLLISASCFSQAYEGKIDYDKKKQKALVIDYNYPQEAVQNALVQKIESMGNSALEEKGMFNRDKGFIVFKNAFVKDISEKSMDYIVKIERKSRKEDDKSTVYFILNKDGENALSGDEYTEKAKSFLNDLLPDIEAAHLEIRIRSQEEVVTKAEKKFKDLQDDQKSLEKKIKDLQEDLKNNEKNQEDQQKLLKNQKQLLEELRSKRKA